MRSSEMLARATLLVLAATLADSRADQLALSGEARLTGAVRSINVEGTVELASELSTGPVLLRPEAVRKITFDTAAPLSDRIGGMIELVNGDLLPAGIGSFDGRTLKLTTPDAGALGISRDFLKSMQLGVHRQKAIYSGPNSLEEWAKDVEGARNWRYVNGVFAANGPAVAMRKIDVPEQFVFRFNLKWQVSPSFTVYFADPLTPGSDKVDRYLMQMSPQGVEIKRESATGQKIQSVILPIRGADEFPSNRVSVEIRVNRKSSHIDLLLDGQPEASGIDPVSNPPTGSGFIFISSSPTGSTQEISGIELLDFDNSQERHRAEDRGDPKSDSMISRDDDRWGGHLTGIRQDQDGTVLTFKSDFQEDPLELLDSDVSTIFFAKPENEVDPGKADSWILKLRGGGSLHVSSCEFSDTRVTAMHPLLGKLEIDRGGVTALERLQPGKEENQEE